MSSPIYNINHQNTLNLKTTHPISNQNTVKIIKIPFPPSIRVDEIVQLHLENGIKNVNQTMNAFMIYRKEYSQIVTNYNLELKDISLYASISWKQEPQNVKNHYKQLAKRVKELFKEKVPSLCFINSNLVSSTNDNNVSLDTLNSPFLNKNQNPPPPLDDQNSPYVTYSNYPFLDINALVTDNFEDSLQSYMTMDDDEFMNYLSEDLALTYRSIIQSLA